MTDNQIRVLNSVIRIMLHDRLYAFTGIHLHHIRRWIVSGVRYAVLLRLQSKAVVVRILSDGRSLPGQLQVLSGRIMT